MYSTKAQVLLLATLGVMFPLSLQARTYAEIKQAGALVWGADEEGGGPYVYPREDDPEKITGFEFDLANKLAEKLNLQAIFFQGNWDKLSDLLKAKKFDIIINGYEATPVRREVMEGSIPYYIYGLQLMTRKNDSSIASWDDLRRKKNGTEKRKIGVLTGSAAEDYMREHYGNDCQVINYDGNTDSMREVETGKLDATLQDTPIASFYAPRFPALHFVGEPLAPGQYLIYARKGEVELMGAINLALAQLIQSGELETIYRRYGLWNAQQQALNAAAASILKKTAPVPAAGSETVTEVKAAEPEGNSFQRKRGWTAIRVYGFTLVKAAGMTVLLSVVSFPLAMLLGLLVALGRLYGAFWLRLPLAGYVEFLRGTPLMLQLYFIFFFLPELGVNIPAFPTAILGLALNYSAYESEIYRAGIQAIPHGQMDAALSLGMNHRQGLRYIVVPQAFRIVIPPMVNDFIALFKDTSVCSVVTVIELTKRYSVMSMSTQATVELMLLTAILYMLMSFPLAVLSQRLEKRLGVRSPL